MATIGGSKSEETAASTPIEEWVDHHGDALFRYALARVSDVHTAEDLLQETFLAALRGFDGFQKKSSLRTWLTSILHKKIVDYYRREMKSRVNLREQLEPQHSASEDIVNRAQKWDLSPERTLENREFWAVLDDCLDKLPKSLLLAFRLREIDERDTKQICQALDIDSQNLAVRVYRARLALRECLSRNWFTHGE